MGLHWIYDIERLSNVGGNSPEFRTPDPQNYEGVVGVFAHGGRPVGSNSRYGATVDLVAQHVSKNDGRYDAPQAAAQFLATFGYGGSFVGYVDHPAAGALDVIRKRDPEIEDSFRALTDRIPFHTIVAIGPIVQRIASARDVGDAKAQLTEALADFPDVSLNEEQLALVTGRIDDLHRTYWKPTGVADLQLPVLAPVIPVALVESLRGRNDKDFIAAVRSAAHLTHVDEDALAIGDFVAFLIRDVLSDIDLQDSIDSRLKLLPDELARTVRDALAAPWEGVVRAAESLGMSCALAEGLPLSLVTLLHADSYVEAVRSTILSGGDSCGRGILVGALAGLRWGFQPETGVPKEWIERVEAAPSVQVAAEKIF
jgi:hypothetical protein